MSEIVSTAWIVSHRVEMWLLILVTYLLQRNVNSGHLPTKAVDPEAFMNIVSWSFHDLMGILSALDVNVHICVVSALCITTVCGGDSC